MPRYKYDAHSALNEMLERLSRNRSSIGANANSDDYEEQGNIREHDVRAWCQLNGNKMNGVNHINIPILSAIVVHTEAF